MRVTRTTPPTVLPAAVVACAATLPVASAAVATAPISAQEPEQVEVARVEVTPATLTLEVGEKAQLTAVAYDADGEVVDVPLLFFSRSGRGRLAVDRSTGEIEAFKGGEYDVDVLVMAPTRARGLVKVTVPWPPLDRVDISEEGGRYYVGVTTRHKATVLDEADDVRDLAVTWSTSDESVATVDRHGVFQAHAPGEVTLSAAAEGVVGRILYEVADNPVTAMTLEASQARGRTGDVIRVTATPANASGATVDDIPVTFGLIADPDAIATADFPPAEVDGQGRFVAYKPGVYTVTANVPGHTAHTTLEILERHAVEEVTLVGHAPVRNVSTSDLWVWEGVDGRDYAITGTHAAHGSTYWWDVTDPANPVLTDSLVVDARTTNDVKVSEDGEICVISREGASSRRNGIVIVDCTDPRNIEIISTFDDELTGGVHNLFIYDDHVYAVNNGIRFDVVNIEDPANPHRVGRFELDTPGHAIHDIWIVDGIAYTSNWGDGVAVIDVGGGDRGGSPANPVLISRFRDIGGATHAAFPYKSPTGKFYIFMGDERGAPGFDGQDRTRTPDFMSGYIHIVDFTDPGNPEEVARYEVPEAGSHNMWIEDDRLYAAFYQGGLRVVDISGELKGNLYHQGREIAVYKAFDPDGVVANAPFTWGPQMHKGNLFFAEYFSGMWAVKLQPRRVLIP
ncbi:MAG: Ig-like domain-containing protein [Gemmatimonadota bacterium]|nr:Ig-like domain-containing protein [Gemmatimonadota bacterium]MDE2984466.1 Ig-like domain-containing protein [Gemmatimonadota bacterium]